MVCILVVMLRLHPGQVVRSRDERNVPIQGVFNTRAHNTPKLENLREALHRVPKSKYNHACQLIELGPRRPKL